MPARTSSTHFRKPSDILLEEVVVREALPLEILTCRLEETLRRSFSHTSVRNFVLDNASKEEFERHDCRIARSVSCAKMTSGSRLIRERFMLLLTTYPGVNANSAWSSFGAREAYQPRSQL